MHQKKSASVGQKRKWYLPIAALEIARNLSGWLIVIILKAFPFGSGGAEC